MGVTQQDYLHKTKLGLMDTFSKVVLVLVFLSIPVILDWTFLNARLERIHAGGYGWFGCTLRYLAQGLGIHIVVAIFTLACLMLLATGSGPAWIWPFFFGGMFFYFGIGWVIAWVAVGVWYILHNVYRAAKLRSNK